MHRWLITAAALLAGAATTALLLWYGNPERGASDVFVMTRDVAAGSVLGADSVRLEPARLAPGARGPLGPESARRVAAAVAAHDLQAGQLLQASDLAGAGVGASDRRLVMVPVRDAPPVAPGDRVDLLLVGGGDHPSVQPFMLGLEVGGVTPAGLVVIATSRAASGLVYAASTAHLVAVVAARSSARGQEGGVSSMQDALAAVRQ
jgi:hypothetical protein